MSGTKVQSAGGSLLWLLAASCVVAAIIGNSYFSEELFVYRLLGIVGLSVLAIVFASFTDFGKQARTMMVDSRNELKRVVWPKRQETAQVTMIVLVIVVIFSLLLWGFDSLISYLVGTIITELSAV